MTQKPGERVRNPSLQENFQPLVLFCRIGSIKAKGMGLPPVIHRQQALSAA
jgi:hypothetical protein